jgi:integrase/recombinase XerD
MTDRFDLFIREKTFLQNLAPRTIKYYKECWNAFTRYKGELSEQGVKEFMMSMLEAGMKPGSPNAFARGMNVYFAWLKANKYIEEQLKVPLVKTEKRVLRTYRPEDMQKIINYHPEYFGEKRLMALLATLVDCGLRIDEALTLERKGVDLDNLLLTVAGKGRKERVVPFSRDLRKVLYKWLKEHNNALVFCTRRGDKLGYDNVRRDFHLLLDNNTVNRIRRLKRHKS